jgi:hypothetical protein
MGARLAQARDVTPRPVQCINHPKVASYSSYSSIHSTSSPLTLLRCRYRTTDSREHKMGIRGLDREFTGTTP